MPGEAQCERALRDIKVDGFCKIIRKKNSQQLKPTSEQLKQTNAKRDGYCQPAITLYSPPLFAYTCHPSSENLLILAT